MTVVKKALLMFVALSLFLIAFLEIRMIKAIQPYLPENLKYWEYNMQPVEIILTDGKTLIDEDGRPHFTPATDQDRTEIVLHIPKAYLPVVWDRQDRQYSSSYNPILIHATLPDMRPISLRNDKTITGPVKEYLPEPKFKNEVKPFDTNIFITQISVVPYLSADYIKRMASFIRTDTYKGIKWGLYHYKPTELNLPGARKENMMNDYFSPVEKKDGLDFAMMCFNIHTYLLSCSVDAMLDERMAVSYEFDRDYLPQWREINRRVRILVESFIMKRRYRKIHQINQ